MLHHAPSSSACWEHLLSELPLVGLQGLAIDLPGFGGSVPPPRPPDLTWYAATQLAARLLPRAELVDLPGLARSYLPRRPVRWLRCLDGLSLPLPPRKVRKVGHEARST
jgi:pimeloyl-ACP methyl ester carboxylesterase